MWYTVNHVCGYDVLAEASLMGTPRLKRHGRIGKG